jgi:hypothetical protein
VTQEADSGWRIVDSQSRRCSIAGQRCPGFFYPLSAFMPLRLSFNLDDADLQHFAEVALETQALARNQSQDAIIAASDPDWKLSDEDRQRVINALACFSPPSTPGSATGLLDRAIMIELVSRDLHHDLEAYRDFSKYREAHSTKRRAAPGADREAWLRQKGATLQARMHKRRMRDLDAAGGSVKKLFSLFRP